MIETTLFLILGVMITLAMICGILIVFAWFMIIQVKALLKTIKHLEWEASNELQGIQNKCKEAEGLVTFLDAEVKAVIDKPPAGVF